MSVPRPFSLVGTHDQWLRASHERTALVGDAVQLGWRTEAAGTDPDPTPFAEPGAGLAFDPHCRLYHSVPDEGRVERLRWSAQDPLRPSDANPAPVDLIAAEASPVRGDFVLTATPAALAGPRGLAVDVDDRLFVAEAGAGRILVFDLWSERLLRAVDLGATPVDLAVCGRTVYALAHGPSGLFALEARAGLRAMPWPAPLGAGARLAMSPCGGLYLLEAAGTASARVWRYRGGEAPEAVRFPTAVPGATTEHVPFATDLEFQPASAVPDLPGAANRPVLVVACRPGEDFRRFLLESGAATELPPLKARGYDGLGIVSTPDGRIGFWTRRSPGPPADRGVFRHAVAGRLRFERAGAVTTFRLDSGEFQTFWGRVFLDACIPRDTSIRVRCVATDEPPDEPPVPRQPPTNSPAPPPHPELSPPLPPVSVAQQLAAAARQELHRRETGRELPWVRRPADDPFETYETPVLAEAGRYLWVRLEFEGNTRTTPRLRAVRAERPTHDYLRRLPQVFSRDDAAASFLRRYLALFEGFLGELEGKADARHVLLDPRSAPPEILPWLAGFLGLTLDERMARAPRPGGRLEDVRPTLVSEAARLFRFRGTVAGLRRFLEIYLGVSPILIEKFRVRGLGGALLGDATGPVSNSVLGAGFRVGGAVGQADAVASGASSEDAFRTHAHRFTVMIPARLSEEALAVVGQILEVHRPAHTLVDVCTVGSGMRVGRGLHVELTSIIGRTGGFQPYRAGDVFLGRGSMVGRPVAGVVPAASRLGQDTRVG